MALPCAKGLGPPWQHRMEPVPILGAEVTPPVSQPSPSYHSLEQKSRLLSLFNKVTVLPVRRNEDLEALSIFS